MFIAMIPARLGSKRIKKKNIRYLGNKPLIQYPIDLAKKSRRFDSIWVNTESEILGQVAEQLGVNFHKRPQELATDNATNREFTYEFLQKHECDYVIMINPTSPLLSSKTLENFLNYIEENDFDTVLSVVDYKEEAFYRNKPINFTYDKKINSQFIEAVRVMCWALTGWKKSTFMDLQRQNKNPVFGGNIGLFSIPKDESCDLDTPEDWRIAEGHVVAKEQALPKKYLELDSELQNVDFRGLKE